MPTGVALLCAGLGTCLLAQEGSFLDTFFHHAAGPKIQAEKVDAGYLARPVTGAPAPAVLLMPAAALDEKACQWARDLAGTGFAVLAVDHEPEKASQWLAAQSFVDPQRVAGIAWTVRIPAALRLMTAARWKAMVLWGGTAPPDSRIPVLSVPADRDPDQAWIDVYQFLDGTVEDAPPQIARVVDIMRVINSGVRGELAASLVNEPATPEQWEQARSRAAILAEAGYMLLTRRPPKADPEGWKRRANEYRDAATALFHAVEHHDFPGAHECLQQITQTCGGCHADYR